MNSRVFIGVSLLFTAMAFSLIGYQIAEWRDDEDPASTVRTPQVKVQSALDQEISIHDIYIKSAGIKVEQVRAGKVTGEILAPAIIAPIPGAEATVIARAAGTITKINKRLGDDVRAGEAIAWVDSLEATRMTAERSTAITKLELAKKVFARESALFEKGVTPRQEMEAAQSALAVAEAESSRAAMILKTANVGSDGRTVSVISPVSGKVTSESAIVGAFVQPDAELFKVANHDNIQIEAYITASDLTQIKAGDSATIFSRNGAKVTAKVRSITPSVSGTNQTATAVLIPEDDAPSLVLGEGVQVRLHAATTNENDFIVPEDAVQNLEGRDVVFIRTQSGFRPHPVVVGQRSNGFAQILSGLDLKAIIATQNAFLIKAEMIKNAPEED